MHIWYLVWYYCQPNNDKLIILKSTNSNYDLYITSHALASTPTHNRQYVVVGGRQLRSYYEKKQETTRTAHAITTAVVEGGHVE